MDWRLQAFVTMAQRMEHFANACAKEWGEEGVIRDIKRNVRHFRENLEELATYERQRVRS